VLPLLYGLATGDAPAQANSLRGAEDMMAAGPFVTGAYPSMLLVANTQMRMHRQAAVARYLLKKKMRSFKKKVRYESRKRLAESRPRVRGQFVKQVPSAAPAAASDECEAEDQLTSNKRQRVDGEEKAVVV